MAAAALNAPPLSPGPPLLSTRGGMLFFLHDYSIGLFCCRLCSFVFMIQLFFFCFCVGGIFGHLFTVIFRRLLVKGSVSTDKIIRVISQDWIGRTS